MPHPFGAIWNRKAYGTNCFSTGSNESRAWRLLMLWTAPATGIAMCKKYGLAER